MSLIPICGKIFERITFSSLYQLIEELKLLLIQKSSFRSNGSCISQLLFIFHTLYKAFDAYLTLDTRGVFLNTSKPSDKIRHEGLIFNLKSVGVSNLLLKLIQSFWTNRFQRVLLNGETSVWLPVNVICHKGLLLVSSFFSFSIKKIIKNRHIKRKNDNNKA